MAPGDRKDMTLVDKTMSKKSQDINPLTPELENFFYNIYLIYLKDFFFFWLMCIEINKA